MRVRVAIVVFALVVVARAWTGLVVDGAVPAFDAADYLARALRALDGDVAQLLRPDLHPPGWPATLALWMGALGRSMAVARALPVVLALVSIGGLAALGRKVDPERGALAGAVAGLVALCTSEHLRLLTAPMSEPLAYVVTLVALGAAVDTIDARDPWPHLRFGLCVLASAFVRYNLPPMLVAPVLLHRVATRRRLDVAPFLWVAPTLLAFLTWEAAQRGALGAVGGFYRNLDSGLPFWEDLVWVPRSLAEDYFGWPGAVLFVGAFVAALRRPSSPEAKLVAASVIVSVVAITIHPYKLARTLHPVVPLAALVVTLAFARASRRTHAVAGAIAGTWALWQLGPGVMALRGHGEFVESPAAVAIVDRAVRAAESGASVKVVSSGRHVAYVAVEAAIRLRGLPARAESDSPALNLGDAVELGPHLAQALRPVAGGPTVWVAIADDEVYKPPKEKGAPRPKAHPSVYAAAAFDEAAAAHGLRLLDRVEDPEGLLNASFWGEGGAAAGR